MILPGPKMMIVSGPGVTWNPDDKHADIVLSNGDRTATNTTGSNRSVRATKGFVSGKTFWEVTTTGTVYGRPGIATASATLGNYIGFDVYGWSYSDNGAVRNNGTIVVTYSAFVEGDVIGLCLDLDNNKLFLAKNGVWQGGGNPNTNTGGISIAAGEWFPSATAAEGRSVTLNFSGPFVYL